MADQQQTLAALLRGNSVRIPRSFIGEDRGSRGSLAEFVRQHRGRAMDLYLLALSAADGTAHVPPIPAAVWGRALGLEQESAEPIISRLWRWLESQGLLESGRSGRLKTIRLLGIEARPRDVLLSLAFFRGNFHNRLSIPAKAVLLAALAENARLKLTDDDTGLYGLNRDTIRRGLHGLRTIGLIRPHVVRIPSPLTTQGFTFERTYYVLAPFGELPSPND